MTAAEPSQPQPKAEHSAACAPHQKGPQHALNSPAIVLRPDPFSQPKSKESPHINMLLRADG